MGILFNLHRILNHTSISPANFFVSLQFSLNKEVWYATVPVPGRWTNLSDDGDNRDNENNENNGDNGDNETESEIESDDDNENIGDNGDNETESEIESDDDNENIGGESNNK